MRELLVMTRRGCCCGVFGDLFTTYTDCSLPHTNNDYTDSFNYPLSDINDWMATIGVTYSPPLESQFQTWLASSGRSAELVNYDLRLEWASVNGHALRL